MNCRANNVTGDELSILGFGCMRFPKDESKTEQLVLHAIDKGINYFDTAYIYPNSEATLGRILAKHNMREKINIATKIPPSLIRKPNDFDKYLNQQLERLQTDYIDYYLIHMVTDVTIWNRLVDLGAEEWIAQKKTEGKIRSIGFSYHGGKDEFLRICDAHPWEFCLLQYNYLDEDNQAGRGGLQHASSKGMPVMIMEPLRGGRLATDLPKGAIEAFQDAYIQRTPAQWSFRWLWDQPEVTCVLSGMNDMRMLEENIETASTAQIGAFTNEDFKVIARAKQALIDAIKVPCTGCGYCMPCPQGVDIPTCLSSYNNIVIEGKRAAFGHYVMQTALKSKPHLASQCNRCGRCVPKCPQGIDIPVEMQNAKKALEKFYFKPMLSVTRRFMKL